MRRALLPLLLGLWAGAAGAAPPDVADAEAWRGRYCTPADCTGDPRSTTRTAAGFAAAVVAAAWWSSRGAHPRRSVIHWK